MGTSVQNLRFFRPSVKCREVTHQKIMSDNKELGEKYGIHPRDVEKVKFAFDVYDFKGDGKVDGFYIGDLLRACQLNPTLLTINEVGGMKERARKSWSSMTFTQSLPRSSLPRTKVVSTISLKSRTSCTACSRGSRCSCSQSTRAWRPVSCCSGCWR